MKLSVTYDIKEDLVVGKEYDKGYYTLLLNDETIYRIIVDRISILDIGFIRFTVNDIFLKLLRGESVQQVINIKQDKNNKNIYHCIYSGWSSRSLFVELMPVKIDMNKDHSLPPKDEVEEDEDGLPIYSHKTEVMNFIYNEIQKHLDINR